MSVNYSTRYKPHQLEPFFPNEIIKMFVSVLGTLAVIVFLALLVPEGEETPADPRSTPAHIKPEWYFLATYQSLKLMPQSLFGISGKLLGVLVQTVIFLTLLSVPFWYRKSGPKSPGFRAMVTAGIASFVVLTVWGIWPEDSSGSLGSPAEFLHEHWLFAAMIGLAIAAFAFFMAWERHVIRRSWRA